MTARSPGVRPWLLAWVVLVALQIAVSASTDRAVGSAEALFGLVTVAASGCVITSGWLLVRAQTDDIAELGLIGAYSYAVSVLPLVHGLTVPGVLYGANEATMTAVLWAVPLASIAAAPLLLPRSAAGLLRHWRIWVAVNIALHTTLAISLLVQPSLLPLAAMGTPVGASIALVGLGLSMALSARHLRLYAVSRRRAVLAVSISFALISSAGLVWINGNPMAPGFWLAHVVDIIGVFVVSVVAAIAYRRGTIERDVFRPLTLRAPLDALEYGLDPIVRAFVADLGRKDPITREHVKRTAETAIVVGEDMGLAAAQLRTLGLGALLHDVGKLQIDDEILNKPGRLTAEEFDHVKQHTSIGERLVASSPVLHDIAGIVRHHHERIDGDGYPDGLSGAEIPLLARIVSVCDAYDAMMHTRQYRQAMDPDLVIGILREHAGSQWDTGAVDGLIRVIAAGRVAEEPTVLADVGGQIGCSCTFDLPATRALLPN